MKERDQGGWDDISQLFSSEYCQNPKVHINDSVSRGGLNKKGHIGSLIWMLGHERVMLLDKDQGGAELLEEVWH